MNCTAALRHVFFYLLSTRPIFPQFFATAYGINSLSCTDYSIDIGIGVTGD